MANVATTRIEKKYKDKKTGEYKTINIDYALVPDRLLEFRKKHPRAVIETKPSMQAGNVLVFQAKIIQDKKDPNSAEATGHAYGKLDSEKAFEKTETMAVGRALALLGYLNNGKVATTEEMEEFEAFQMDRLEEEINSAQKREDFKVILAKLTPEQQREATPLINKRIKELANGNPS